MYSFLKTWEYGKSKTGWRLLNPFLRRVLILCCTGRSPDSFFCNAFPCKQWLYLLQSVIELTVSGNVRDLHPVPF
jgi:hypothetical protein